MAGIIWKALLVKLSELKQKTNKRKAHSSAYGQREKQRDWRASPSLASTGFALTHCALLK